MKRLFKKSWLIPVMTMVMVVGMGLTAIAVPSFPADISDHESDCQHTDARYHIYATGNTYSNGTQEFVECCMYGRDGFRKEFYAGSGITLLLTRFEGNKVSQGWYYGDGNNFFPCQPHAEEDEEEDLQEYVDHDTFKSEAPSKTVIASGTLGAKQFYDLKVHAADERTKANQAFLLQYYIGANAKILLTENIYPGRDLSITENGSLQTLTWNNLPKNQAGPVYSVVYNQTDKAYVINGTLDANGTAVFSGFKLRPASTITICK